MTYTFGFMFFVTDARERRIPARRLETMVESLMAAMVDRETELVFDASVGAALSKGEVDVNVSVDARSESSGKSLAADFVTEAIRSIGGTPRGLFVFPKGNPRKSPRHDWHERRAELTDA